MIGVLLAVLSAMAVISGAVASACTVDRFVIRQWAVAHGQGVRPVEAIRREWRQGADVVRVLSISLWVAMASVIDDGPHNPFAPSVIGGLILLVCGGVLVPSAIGRQWAQALAPAAIRVVAALSAVTRAKIPPAPDEKTWQTFKNVPLNFAL